MENSKLLSIARGALRISCCLPPRPSLWLCPFLSASAKLSFQGCQRSPNAPAPLFTLPPRLAGALPHAALAVTHCCFKSQRAPLLLQSLPSLLCFHAGFFHSALHCSGTQTCLPHVGLSSASTVPHSGDAYCVFDDRADCLWQVPSWGGTHTFSLIRLHPEFSHN